MMVEYDNIYPGYGFASNKGYGSAEHIKALKEIGPSPIHRASFYTQFYLIYYNCAVFTKVPGR